MEISFANDRLQKLCESEKELRKSYGVDGAKRVMRRMSDLRAASTLEEMRNLPGRIHELEAERKGQLAIELASGRRLVLEPTNGWPAGKEAGKHVWGSVDAVRIIEIIDYH